MDKLPRLDLSKALNESGNHQYTLRSLTQRKTNVSVIDNEFIQMKLFYDKNPYLMHTPRIPRNKALGPLVSIFERFANWANPKFQVFGYLTFAKIEKANSTMNVSETFIFCEQFGLFDNGYITKPEIMALFAMTVCANSDRDSKYFSELQVDAMREFTKNKSRHSRDLTEQKFPFFLCRVAIVIFSKINSSLSSKEKVIKFIKHFRLNDLKYVKTIICNAKSRKTKKFLARKFLLKKSGLTNAGAMGLQKIHKYLNQILCDVDIATAVRPSFDLQILTSKRDWIPFGCNHLNISNIFICDSLNILKQYAFKINVTNKHQTKSILINVNPLKVPKYLTLKYTNKVLSPGMSNCIFIKFASKYDQIIDLNGRRLRSFLMIDIIEKHHYNLLKKENHKIQNKILQTISVPITTCFQFIQYKSTQDIFLSEQICTPRDYPINYLQNGH